MGSIENEQMRARLKAEAAAFGEKAERRAVEFAGGARRTSRRPMYHLVPVELLAAVADTRAEGDRKYQPSNWKQGDKGFFLDCINHAIEHLYDAGNMESRESITTHLGHAACNIGFILWGLARGKLTRNDFARAAVVEADEKQAAYDVERARHQEELTDLIERSR